MTNLNIKPDASAILDKGSPGPGWPCAWRRQLLLASLAATLLPGLAAAQRKTVAQGPLVEVWKSPTCGCCKDWVEHLQASGFRTQVHELGNTAMRARLGIAQELGSCHSARVDGYVIEGHVPAADIRRLLQERPKAIGLAVPRMPIGSPGMDGAGYAGHQEAYAVLLVARDGATSVYSSHKA